MHVSEDDVAVLGFERAGPDAARLVLSWRGWDYRVEIGASELEERARLMALVQESERRLAGSSYWHISDTSRDRASERNRRLWAELARWEYWTIVGPVLGILRWRARILLYTGCHEGFHARRAVEQAVLDGHIDASQALDFHPIPLWGGLGCARLEALIAARRLPRVHGEHLTLALLPPPPGIRATAEDFVDRWGIDEFRACWEQFRAGFLIERWTARLTAALAARATRLGARVLRPERGQLLRHLAVDRALPGEHTLVVIGHQDDAGLHCVDGPLSLPTRTHALAAAPRERRPYDAVDLAVCHADEDDNLARLFQAHGVPLVSCRGPFAYYGRAAAAWLVMLGLLERRGPESLGVLHNEAWFGEPELVFADDWDQA